MGQGWSAQHVGTGGPGRWRRAALSGCRALGSGPSWPVRGVGGGKLPLQGHGVESRERHTGHHGVDTGAHILFICLLIF